MSDQVDLVNYVFYASLVLILIPIFLVVIPFKSQPLYFKWLAVGLIFSFSCDMTSEISSWYGISPNIAGTTYSIFRPLIYSFFFYSYIQWESLKKPLIVFNILFLIFAFVNILFVQKTQINNYTSVTGHLYILGLTIVYFYKLLKELPEEKIYTTGLFWVVCGLYFNTSGRLVLYSFTYYLLDVYHDNMIIFAHINLGLIITGTLIITYGTWLQFKKIRISEPS
jgi:hypothetical protein